MSAFDSANQRRIPAAANGETSSLPAITLPKGGGAIRGVDEKSSVNPATGAAAATISIPITPGRNGFSPALALTYGSDAGNGPFGLGWTLSLPHVALKTARGVPSYGGDPDSNVFILSDAEDLVPLLTLQSGSWQRARSTRSLDGEEYVVVCYRPRSEGPFARIERWTRRRDNDTFWRSISRDNVSALYGRTAASRIVDPSDPTGNRVFSWLICDSWDDRGNAIAFEYVPEDSRHVETALVHERNRTLVARSANRYLKRIKYSNRQPRKAGIGAPRPNDWLMEFVIDYGDHDQERPTPTPDRAWPARPDPFSSYRAGFDLRSYRRCHRVLMFHRFPELGAAPCLVRSLELRYDALPAGRPAASFLTQATTRGFVRLPNGAYRSRALPPLDLAYTPAVIDATVHEANEEALEHLPAGLGDPRVQLIDLDGEGTPGALTETAGAWYYKHNLSRAQSNPASSNQQPQVAFSAATVVAPAPAFGASTARPQFLDFDGDGRLELALLSDSGIGVFERTEPGAWQALVSLPATPRLDWQDANLRFVDLTGDGLADILITEDEALTWYRSLGKDGFAAAERLGQALDEERGPRLVFADGAGSIYLADCSGDGLIDLVRIRNGEISYWPNLGHGRFGARVTMDRSPRFDLPDQFDQGRLRLADIDGSGTTDLIYLGRDGVDLYFNLSGNAWSEPVALGDLLRTDDIADVTVADLLGTGTACLVWSSTLPGDGARPLRYVHLMSQGKPHLLASVQNNLGLETRIRYAPSTHFAVADRLAGRPWLTHLPFPVQVVERVESYDRIARNRYVARYAYHHGHFDGEEREFRGFGMVEQWDTAEIGSVGQEDASSLALNLDQASFMPPVQTKTWFHTGAFLEGERIESHFRTEEYYAGDAQAVFLDDDPEPGSPVDPPLTAGELVEMTRAMKGAMLRQEVYGDDDDATGRHPYRVTEQGYAVQRLQPRADNRHAVFSLQPRETIEYFYERNPADPRIAHRLVLDVDPFGTVLKSATIGYARRAGAGNDDELRPQDRAVQGRPLMTYVERSMTNAVERPDDYRTPMLAETRTYELTGFVPAGGRSTFSATDFVDRVAGEVRLRFTREIPYEGAPGGGRERRLIDQVRTLYRRDDLGGPLALGKVEARALPYETYQLALTPSLLAAALQRNGQPLLSNPAAVLQAEGGYVHTRDANGVEDGNWWLPSGRVRYSQLPNPSAAAELSFARNHFFAVHRATDPFGQSTTFHYDQYTLLLEEAVDPLGNRVATIERDGQGAVIARHNDYRVLQPALVVDPNGNRVAVAVDALGLVVGTAIMGKAGESVGDRLAGFVTDLDETTIRGHFAQPLAAAQALLGQATSRVIYDLFAYQRTRHTPNPQPAAICTLARETHAADLTGGARPRIQQSFSYSDGSGREIQRKVRAEPGPLQEAGADRDPRWIGTGWTVFNNKGLPIRRYEPFFSGTHHYEAQTVVGVSSVACYDPAGRVVATLHPDSSWEKVVVTPWRQETWDSNDTVLVNPLTDADAGAYLRRLPAAAVVPTWHARRISGALGMAARRSAEQTAVHAGTPAIIHSDVLGRPFLTVTQNRFQRDDALVDESYRNQTQLDIEGNLRAIVDARGRVAMRYQFGLSGIQLRQTSIEAGERWTLEDVQGQPIRAWDERGHALRCTYDALRRPVQSWVRGARPEQPNQEVLVGRTEYGEGRPNAAQHNTRTLPYRTSDSSGVTTHEAYDFKGNLLRVSRQLLADYTRLPDWSANPALEPETFTHATSYDALNRPRFLTLPDRSVVRPTYGESGLVQAIDVNLRGETAAGQPRWTPFLTRMAVNARGQQLRVEHANGTVSSYAYDPLTFRLQRLQTRREPSRFDDGCAGPSPAPCGVQNLHYTYDPVGNITEIRDEAQQAVFFRNQRVEPAAQFTYDAVYRLIAATGREHLGQSGGALLPPVAATPGDMPRIRLPHPNDRHAFGRYTERYRYDETGNILELRHRGDDPLQAGWTRCYQYALASNRLLSTGLLTSAAGTCATSHAATPIHPQHYHYDDHGNMTRMPHLPLLGWNAFDQLQRSSAQVVSNGGTPETTYYVYDAAGQRVRKVTERQAAPGATPTRRDERIYLGGYEIFRTYGGNGTSVSSVRETLHVAGGSRRIALVETRIQPSSGAVQERLVRFQYDNHLGSASLELDELGHVISYEEYYPFGGTSYQAGRSAAEAGQKRYRYAGQERDEETGLDYCGARYYAPWLGRWTSCDPAGMIDGANLYRYARNNPIKYIDPGGANPCDPEITSCYVDPKKPMKEASSSQKVTGWIDDKGQVHPTGKAPVLNLEPPPPKMKPDMSPGGFAQGFVTQFGNAAKEKIESIPEGVAAPLKEVIDAGKKGGLEAAGTAAAKRVVMSSPIVGGALALKGLGEDLATIPDEASKAIDEPNEEKAGAHAATMFGAILSVGATVVLPEEGALEKGLLTAADEAALASRATAKRVDVAFGLGDPNFGSRSGLTLDEFARRRNATYYRGFTEAGLTDLPAAVGENRQTFPAYFRDSLKDPSKIGTIHFNLEGVGTVPKILSGAAPAYRNMWGPQLYTKTELLLILENPELFEKAVFWEGDIQVWPPRKR
jgi:RHS repeat-associated protein